jgi:prepilin-type N-terminal cleavage/methylation domain-containing protein
MRMQRQARRLPAQAGFTLIEALIASSIFLIVLYGVYVVYDVGEVNYNKGSRKWDVQTEARIALERMAREIRAAGYASPKVSDPVVIATNDTLSVHADLGDGSGPKYITYSLRDCNGNVGTTLYRNVSTNTYCGGDPFIDDVAGLTFTFYELNNLTLPYPLTSTYQLDGQDAVTGTTVPSAPTVGSNRSLIKQIKISLNVQQQVRGVTIPFTATTDVALRNLIP